MIVTAAVIFFAVFLFSSLLVWLVYRYSEKHSVLDLPNERSSHTEPTATGGGLAISACIIIAILVLSWQGLMKQEFLYAVAPPLIAIILTGWLDDHRHIRSIYRGIIYFSSALWVVYFLGGFSELNLGGSIIDTGFTGIVLAILGIVWLTNLYNFMDGIDGLAAVEAITTAVLGGVFLFMSGLIGESVLCLVVTAAASAYLIWNWPPARIFMGDVGSCPLGFLFASLALWSHGQSGPGVYVWLILLSVFTADATYTLIMRLVQRQKWYSAHRTHAYQKLVQMGYTHGQVSTGIFMLNVILLWPCAWVANANHDSAVFVTTGVYLLMLIFWGVVQYKSRVVRQGLPVRPE